MITGVQDMSTFYYAEVCYVLSAESNKIPGSGFEQGEAVFGDMNLSHFK